MPVAEGDDRHAGLLMKEAAEPGGTEAGTRCDALEGQAGDIGRDEPGGALDGRMHIADGNLGCAFKAMPGLKEQIGEAGVEQGRTGDVGCELGERGVEAAVLGRREAADTGVIVILTQQQPRCGIGSDAADGFAAENGDPHFEVGGELEEHVLLGGEEPEEVAAADLVAPVGEEVGSGAAEDKVELKLGVVMLLVAVAGVSVSPSEAVEGVWDGKALAHRRQKTITSQP